MNKIVYIILVQLFVAGENAQPSSGHMREKRPIISFRGNEDLLIFFKWSHVWHVGVGGKLFHRQVSIA